METIMQINDSIISFGEFYGYPSCCIHSFHQVLRGEKSIHTVQLNAGRGTGFVPCLNHAHQIENGEVQLENLILPTRKCEHAFPKGHKIKAKVKSVDLNNSQQG